MPSPGPGDVSGEGVCVCGRREESESSGGVGRQGPVVAVGGYRLRGGPVPGGGAGAVWRETRHVVAGDELLLVLLVAAGAGGGAGEGE